ncbi:unnamed protein product [Caenorhabditis bovis]|uniref:Vacuolar ATPase assembly integral membrane protein VMA21 homolog n=1 Tax=Caenorhabditis bovis TaxID=2654633 RepID=A0A8S1ETM4_9PELO|nr:unnamed protein product [Caenorhabditis bovis]
MSTEQDFELIEDKSDRKSSTASDSFEEVAENEKASTGTEEDGEADGVETEEEPTLPFVDQSIKDDAERPIEKDGEQLVHDALNAPIRKDQEQFYTAEDSRRAITLLVFFSAMMFTLPLLVMFSLYYWVFIDLFHLPPDRAMLYSGICAAAVVILICAAFAYVAWKEEKDAEEKLKMSEAKKTN